MLVVEDDLTMAETIRDGLTLQSFAVDLRHDGAAGLSAALEGSGGAYDVIVLDIMLPRLRRRSCRHTSYPLSGPLRPGRASNAAPSFSEFLARRGEGGTVTAEPHRGETRHPFIMQPQSNLPPLLHDIAPVLDRWGYVALFAIILVESFGLPTPGQTVMIVAAVYAHWGELNVWLVGVVAFAAAVLGDNIGYWIGARAGRTAVTRWGRYLLVTPDRFAKAEKFFARRGKRVVVIARFIDGLRQLNGVIAGVIGMPGKAFLLYNTIGAALWVGLWVTVAYLFGIPLVRLLGNLHDIPWWAVAAGAAALGGLVWLCVRHIRQRRPHREKEA